MRFTKVNSKRRLERPRARRRVMRVEILGDRTMLDGVGLGVVDPLPWFDPGALTYSFAPDGTRVADQESSLFADLGQLADATQWQQEFDAAFNAWLEPLGASIRQVADAGIEFGNSGQAQGDVRFGDVRIAAVPLSYGTMATSVPHSVMVQGTWAGDILINSDAQWNDLQEVFSVALHEFGHILGLGHSNDLSSPMFFHGVHDAVAPTPTDVVELLDLYAGIRFEPHDDDDDPNPRPVSQPATEPVVSLTPAIGSTVRYASQGSLTDISSSVVFKLEPSLDEAQDLENLNVVVQSIDAARMSVDIEIVDEDGLPAETRVLHHNQGSAVVQASGVTSNRSYFVKVTPAAGSPRFNPGEFAIVMDFGREIRSSEQTAEIPFDEDHVAFEQAISVASSRLIHIRLDSRANLDIDTTIRAVLVDAHDTVLSRIALHPGMSRSAPLTFVPLGDYRLLFSASTSLETLPESQIEVFIDEVSIDVGPGVSDPTGNPYLICGELGADPINCDEYSPIVAPPPVVSDPQPSPYAPEAPWSDYYGYTCSDYQGIDLIDVQSYDPYWWEFYVEVCQTPDPTPPDPTPTDPLDTEPISGWQNQENPLDVSNDSALTTADILMVLEALSHYGHSVNLRETLNAPVMYVDVNGDFVVSPADALMVINALSDEHFASRDTMAAGFSTAALSTTTADRKEDGENTLSLDVPLLF